MLNGIPSVTYLPKQLPKIKSLLSLSLTIAKWFPLACVINLLAFACCHWITEKLTEDPTHRRLVFLVFSGWPILLLSCGFLLLSIYNVIRVYLFIRGFFNLSNKVDVCKAWLLWKPKVTYVPYNGVVHIQSVGQWLEFSLSPSLGESLQATAFLFFIICANYRLGWNGWYEEPAEPAKPAEKWQFTAFSMVVMYLNRPPIFLNRQA